jgi:hypothetical protein
VIHRRGRLVLVPVVAAVTLSWGACGGGSSPTSVPVTTTPAPGPTPTPVAAAPSATCSLGKGAADSTCEAPSGRLLGSVDAAIDQVVATHPDFFVVGEERGQGSRQYRVRDRDGFIEGMLAVLQGQHMCAFRMPLTDTIQVKDSNDFSEQYELVDDRGFIHRGPGSCQTTCTPANFPLDVGESVARIYVGIFRFRCDGAVVTPPENQNLIPIACDAVITMTPKDKYGVNVPFWLHSQNPEFWVRNGENTVVVIGDYPGETFNHWIYPKGVGDFSVCAAVDNKQTCMNGKVIP